MVNPCVTGTGMFPYVCAAMLPVFCGPAAVAKALGAIPVGTGQSATNAAATAAGRRPRGPPSAAKRNAIAACVCAYAALQVFMPYSHFVTRVSLVLISPHGRKIPAGEFVYVGRDKKCKVARTNSLDLN